MAYLNVDTVRVSVCVSSYGSQGVLSHLRSVWLLPASDMPPAEALTPDPCMQTAGERGAPREAASMGGGSRAAVCDVPRA